MKKKELNKIVKDNSLIKYGKVKNPTGYKVRCGEWYATEGTDMIMTRSQAHIFRSERAALTKVEELYSLGQIKERGNTIKARLIPMKTK